MNWMTRVFYSWQGMIFLFATVQTCSDARPVSYPIGTLVFIRGARGKSIWSLKPSTLSSAEVKNVWSYTYYLHSPICLHGVVLS
jgi:hypothetical protein